jgi:hypothetical protein
MPQAPRILSKTQTLTLETCYLFLRTLRPLLLSIGNGPVTPVTREMLDEQTNLAQLNLGRLIESFPALADAAERWKGTGA